jgi:hypothetical protein
MSDIQDILRTHRLWLKNPNQDGAERADLSDANLRSAELIGAKLSGADLRCANLIGANLYHADLSYADMRGVKLSGADLRCTNLSGATGVLNPSEWMAEKFEATNDGYVVYKAIGDTDYNPPEHWIIKPGAVLTEVCNPDRGTECGCGVNFATREWCKRYYPCTIWRCVIEWRDLPGVVVPFNAKDKARCDRLRLVEVCDE